MVYPFTLTQFAFDWNEGGTPTLITAQCESLNVRWDPTDGTGVNGLRLQPPYWFSMYTSIHETPIVLPAGAGPRANLTIPFPPGTFYMLCMYDSAGNPGGCSDQFTVYKPSPNYNATCQDYSVSQPLKVQTARSKYAWVSQCDTVKFEFTDGQPPYQFSIQTALYPPLNVSGITGRSYEWRNTLGRTSSFYATVTDANGRMWSQGPMHSGRGQTWCLDYDSPGKVIFSNIGVVIAGAIALVVFGWAVMASAWFWYRHIRRRESHPRNGPRPRPFSIEPRQVEAAGPESGLTRQNTPMGQYEITPFTPSEGIATPQVNHTEGRGLLAGPSSENLGATPSSSRDDLSRPSSQNVYVVHDNGGRAPVTIYAGESARVVELPPRYVRRSAGQPPAAGPQPDGDTWRPIPPAAKSDRAKPIPTLTSHASHSSLSHGSHSSEPAQRLSNENITTKSRALPQPPGNLPPQPNKKMSIY